MESLKTSLFNKKTTLYVTSAIKKVYPSLKEETFLNEAISSYQGLELKERITALTKLLYKYLPSDYLKAIDILQASIPYTKKDHFVFASYLEYVEKYGCNDQYVDVSLDIIESFTKLFSAEFAIRSFFNKYPAKTLKKMLEWSKSDNVDVRRLASEGSRPSLPWSVKIDVDYKKAMKPLDHLFMDQERYVTRSVANHLNDISKFDPELVIESLSKWKKSNLQEPSEMEYIINHSLRTLVKKGNSKALSFIGFKEDPSIEIRDFELSSDAVIIGNDLHFSFTVFNPHLENLMIDYIITYPSKTSKPSKKVYKLKKILSPKLKNLSIEGKRSFKNLSTRKMKKGLHTIEVQVNGKIISAKSFMVN